MSYVKKKNLKRFKDQKGQEFACTHKEYDYYRENPNESKNVRTY